MEESKLPCQGNGGIIRRIQTLKRTEGPGSLSHPHPISKEDVSVRTREHLCQSHEGCGTFTVLIVRCFEYGSDWGPRNEFAGFTWNAAAHPFSPKLVQLLPAAAFTFVTLEVQDKSSGPLLVGVTEKVYFFLAKQRLQNHQFLFLSSLNGPKFLSTNSKFLELSDFKVAALKIVCLVFD